MKKINLTKEQEEQFNTLRKKLKDLWSYRYVGLPLSKYRLSYKFNDNGKLVFILYIFPFSYNEDGEITSYQKPKKVFKYYEEMKSYIAMLSLSHLKRASDLLLLHYLSQLEK